MGIPAEHKINLLLTSVFSEYGFNTLEVDAVQHQNTGYDIVASIGLTGDVTGFLHLCTNNASAELFMHTVLRNMGMEEETDLETMMPGIITELVNQVGGRYTMILEEEQFNCNITPPTLIAGSMVVPDATGYANGGWYALNGEFGKLLFAILIKQ